VLSAYGNTASKSLVDHYESTRTCRAASRRQRRPLVRVFDSSRLRFEVLGTDVANTSTTIPTPSVKTLVPETKTSFMVRLQGLKYVQSVVSVKRALSDPFYDIRAYDY
jgi:hypothetical protein